MTEQEQKNFHYLVMDIFWFGLAIPATARFIAVYAIRIDATALELSLLTAFPALMLLFASTLSGWWSRHFRDASRATILPGFGYRLSFILPALTPLFPLRYQPLWLILAIAIPAIPQGIASVTFMVMMREALPVDQLTRLISRRYIAMNSAVGFSTLIFGLWLTKAPFPQNYQAMFVVTFLVTMISLWYVHRTRSLHITPQARPDKGNAAWRDKRFRRVLGFAFGTQMSFFIVFPFIPYYLVSVMGGDEQFISMFVLVELLGGIAVSCCSPQIAQIVGHRNLVALGMTGTALSTAIIALVPSLYLTVIGAAVNGVAWTMVGTGMFGYFNNELPGHSMTRYTTLYNQVTYLGIFVGPMLGNLMLDLRLPIVEVILAGSVLRLLMGAIISDVKPVDQTLRKYIARPAA
jgi:MFS family permease